MAHAQKPDFVFPRNGRVHLNRWGRQFSRLLAAEVCASALVKLDAPCSEVAWSTGYTLQSPVSPSLPLPCFTVCHQVPNELYHSYLRVTYTAHTWIVSLPSVCQKISAGSDDSFASIQQYVPLAATWRAQPAIDDSIFRLTSSNISHFKHCHPLKPPRPPRFLCVCLLLCHLTSGCRPHFSFYTSIISFRLELSAAVAKSSSLHPTYITRISMK